jgi:hypothetical protein
MTDDMFENFLQRAARDYNSPPPTPRDAMWARIDAERRTRVASVASRGAHTRRWLVLGAAIAAMLLVGVAIGYVWRGTMDSRMIAERGSQVPDSADRQLAGTGSESTGAHGSNVPDTGHESAGPDGSSSRRELTPPLPAPEQRLAIAPPESRGTSPSAVESVVPPTPRSGNPMGAASRERAAYATLTAEHLGRVEMLLTTYRAESERGRVDPQVTSWAGDLLGTTRLLLDSPGASDPRLRKLLGDLEIVLTQITQLGAEQGSRKDELQIIDQSLRSHDVMTRIRGATPAGAGALPIGT